jgi:hypothetical protein
MIVGAMGGNIDAISKQNLGFKLLLTLNAGLKWDHKDKQLKKFVSLSENENSFH